MEITLIREPGPSAISDHSIIDLTGGSNIYYSLNIAYTKTSDDNRVQIQYCISQMKRFALCMKADEKTLRVHQFFYTVGRIQELLESTPHIWWNPFENMIKEQKYDDIIAYTDFLCHSIGCEYDKSITSKTDPIIDKNIDLSSLSDYERDRIIPIRFTRTFVVDI